MTHVFQQRPIMDLAAHGFRMPAEWLPHAATWVAWPHNPDTWPGHLADAQREYIDLVAAIAADEPVMVLAGPEHAETINSAWADYPPEVRNRIRHVEIPTNDSWARDFAPTFVTNPHSQGLAAVDWYYNAWGGKYPPFDLDQQVAAKMVDQMPDDLRPPGGLIHAPQPLCLEGGALEIDQTGLLLCTRSCALDPNRNPGATAQSVTEVLCRALGATQVIWLEGDALTGDDTDGHIDQLARFTPTGAILYAWTDDPRDPQSAGLARNLDDLKKGLAQLERNDRLVPLPLPDPVIVDGVQIPACYCNFYITNHSVLVPQFGARQDDEALRIIGNEFPGRAVVPLDSKFLTVGLGSFHCLTQQQPAV